LGIVSTYLLLQEFKLKPRLKFVGFIKYPIGQSMIYQGVFKKSGQGPIGKVKARLDLGNPFTKTGLTGSSKINLELGDWIRPTLLLIHNNFVTFFMEEETKDNLGESDLGINQIRFPLEQIKNEELYISVFTEKAGDGHVSKKISEIVEKAVSPKPNISWFFKKTKVRKVVVTLSNDTKLIGKRERDTITLKKDLG